MHFQSPKHSKKKSCSRYAWRYLEISKALLCDNRKCVKTTNKKLYARSPINTRHTYEYYDNNLAVVNGHSYKSENLKSQNTNFAILVTNYFTDPFKEPIEYGKHIAQLGNLLSGNKIIVQRLWRQHLLPWYHQPNFRIQF